MPKLIDVVPEARLNLIIYHLRQNELDDAYELIRDLDPAVPAEYILKGVVNACIGQEQDAEDHLKLAQQYFQLVGGSASEMGEIQRTRAVFLRRYLRVTASFLSILWWL